MIVLLQLYVWNLARYF